MGELLNKISKTAGNVVSKSIDYDTKRATNIIAKNFNNANKTAILSAALFQNKFEPITQFATNTGKEVGKDFISTNKKLIVVPVLVIAGVGVGIGFAIGRYLMKKKKNRVKK